MLDIPIQATEEMLPFTFNELKADILEKIDPVQDSGTYEMVKGNWYFYIDYRADDFQIEYACINIFYTDGKEDQEYISPWPVSQFDMFAQPEKRRVYNNED